MARIDQAVTVATLDALAALTAASTPPRVNGGIYWVSNAGGQTQGRWAQYLSASTATPTAGAILMPGDSVGRWHLGLDEAGEGGEGGGTAGTILASDTAPTGASPTIDPATGEASIILQTGSPPKLWIGVSATEWASVDLSVYSEPYIASDPAAQAYIDRLSGTYTTPQLEAIDAFFEAIRGDELDSGGSMLDGYAIYLMVGSAPDSLLSLLSDAWDASDPGDPPTFVAGQGISFADDTPTRSTGMIPSDYATSLGGIAGIYVRGNLPDQLKVLISTYPSELISISSFGPASPGDDFYLTGGFNAGNSGYSSGAVVPRGAISIARSGNTVVRTINQAVLGTFTAAGSIANDQISFGAPFVTVSAMWWDIDRDWTVAETLRLHGYIETLLDAFGAGVIS